MTYRTISTCHDAGARQARGDRVVADRVQQPAVPGPPQAEQDQRGQRHEHEQAVGHDARGACPTRATGARPGRPPPVWTICSCQTLARPRTTRPMPRVMISGWTRNTPTPMPVRSPARAAAARATTIADGQSPGRRRASRRRTRPSRRPRRPRGRCRRSASSASGSRRGWPAGTAARSDDADPARG